MKKYFHLTALRRLDKSQQIQTSALVRLIIVLDITILGWRKTQDTDRNSSKDSVVIRQLSRKCLNYCLGHSCGPTVRKCEVLKLDGADAAKFET
jgi:hypothetical protein